MLLSSDEGWCLNLSYAEDHIVSFFEGLASISFTPGVWHDYRLVTADFREYDLFVDDQLERHGAFIHVSFHAEMSFGEGVQGAASLHHWGVVSFGTITLGDVNQDGFVTFDDIDPFVEALTLEEGQFQAQHPGWSWLAADCNVDGEVNFDDINPFVALLAGADR